MHPRIFINYRPEDGGRAAQRLAAHLGARLGAEALVIDEAAGADQVGDCDVLLAVIGRAWLTCEGAPGLRRLDQPGDAVRRQIAAALDQRIRVIPVLVDDAVMPGVNLPEALAELGKQAPITISEDGYESNVDDLAAFLQEIPRRPTLPHPSPPVVAAAGPPGEPSSPSHGERTIFPPLPAAGAADLEDAAPIDDVTNRPVPSHTPFSGETPPSAATPRIEPDELEELIGRTFEKGRYRLEKFIARGGFGAVFLGTDLWLNRAVAVKVGPSYRTFLKEGMILGQLTHDHIVRAMSYGEELGRAYLVMDFLNGETLQEVFEQHHAQLPLELLKQLVREIGAALIYAHGRGKEIVHRDLKPRNIMLADAESVGGSRRKFVLLDFGIASKLDVTGTLKNHTSAGAGTIEYMAPELLQTEPSATRLSDVYSFGVILYQMLAGRVPFPQRDGSPLAFGRCVQDIAHAAPPAFAELTDRPISAALEQVVQRCLEKDPAQRPQSIDEVCSAVLQFLEPPPSPQPAPSPQPPPTAPPPADLHDLAGWVVSERFRLDKFLAEGTFGAVYRGTDLLLDRPVAVKVGKVGTSIRDFMKEAKLLAQLEHDHIVRPMLYGAQQGLAYLVMDFLRGETLEEVFQMNRQELPRELLKQLLNEIGDALTHAHGRQMVHRDLKPGNIMLTAGLGGRRKFMLLDFGIASKRDVRDTLENKTFKGAGTLKYMSPEQLQGADATPQSDIYSFGVILYQMLAGRVPFDQGDGSALAFSDCVRDITELSPPWFADVTTRRIAEPVETLVRRCLEKDPARRPQSIDEVCRELLPLLDPPPPPPPPPPPLQTSPAGSASTTPELLPEGLGLQDLSGWRFENRYLLEEYIAEGSFGAVYRGRDEQLGLHVAVKVGKVGVSFRDFKKEGKLLAQLNHPHIVRPLAYGEQYGCAYLVMDFIRGETLERLFDGCAQKLSDELLEQLVRQIGDALIHAHERKLVHRDLKPGNIMLTSGDEGEPAKFVLLDFGIAAKRDVSGTLENATFRGAGTLKYMAPEQMDGADPTPASDVYSFGAILYQMLTGVHSFPTPAPFAEAAPARRRRIGKFERLVFRCLERDPARRPSGMQDVQRDFLKLIQPPPSNRLKPLLAAALLLLCGWAIWSLRPTPPAPPVTAAWTVLNPDGGRLAQRDGAPVPLKLAAGAPPVSRVRVAIQNRPPGSLPQFDDPPLPPGVQIHRAEGVNDVYDFLFSTERNAAPGPYDLAFNVAVGGASFPLQVRLTVEPGPSGSPKSPVAEWSLTDSQRNPVAEGKLQGASHNAADRTAVELKHGETLKLTWTTTEPAEFFLPESDAQLVIEAIGTKTLSREFILTVPDLNTAQQEREIDFRATAAGVEFVVPLHVVIPKLHPWKPEDVAPDRIQAPAEARLCQVADDDRVFASILDLKAAGKTCRFRLVPGRKNPQIESFYISEEMVSNNLLADFLGAPKEWNRLLELETNVMDKRPDREGESPLTDAKPAVNVTVIEAHLFAQWLLGTRSGSIPTADEWDLASGYFDLLEKHGVGESVLPGSTFTLPPAPLNRLQRQAKVGLSPLECEFEGVRLRSPYGLVYGLEDAEKAHGPANKTFGELTTFRDLRLIFQRHGGIPTKLESALKGEDNPTRAPTVVVRGSSHFNGMEQPMTWVDSNNVVQDRDEFLTGTIAVTTHGIVRQDYLGFRVVLVIPPAGNVNP